MVVYPGALCRGAGRVKLQVSAVTLDGTGLPLVRSSKTYLFAADPAVRNALLSRIVMRVGSCHSAWSIKRC